MGKKGRKPNPAARAAAPAPPPPALEREMHTICKLKSVDFGGTPRTIVFPPPAHDSPLVALVNALLLEGVLTAGMDTPCEVPLQHLILKLSRVYSRKLKNLKLTASLDEILKILKQLSNFINISVSFTRVECIESSTVGLDIFQHLKVPLYHLRIVDSQDTIVAPVVGDDLYEIFTPISSDGPPILPPNADQTVLEFINGTEPTTYGLQELSKVMQNNQISVVFWNRTFHTVYKHADDLYVLHNNLSDFEKDILWQELTVRGDGRLCTSSFLPVPDVPTTQVQDEDCSKLNWEQLPLPVRSKSAAASSEVQKLKCNRDNCQFEFCSSFNLSRHHQVHMRGRKAKKDSVDTSHFAIFWDNLSEDDRRELTYIKNAPAINGIHGDIICRCLEKLKPEDKYFKIANELRLLIDCSQRVTSDTLLTVLTEASEATAFSSDINQYPSSIFAKGLFLVRETVDVVAFGSYSLERSLNERWLEYREDEVLQHGSFFEKSESIICRMSGCTLCFNSKINHKRHKSVHSMDFDPKEDFLLNRDDIGSFWDNLTYEEAARLLSFNDMRVQSFRGKRLATLLEKHAVDNNDAHIVNCLKKVLRSPVKITTVELFDLLDKASEESFLCTDVLKCKESIIFGDSAKLSSTSDILACISYMLEKNLVQSWYDSKAVKAGKIEGLEKREL